MKTCIGCKEEKPLSEFSWDSANKRHQSRCKPCRVLQTADYQRSPKGLLTHRRAILKHRYNITPERYDEMLEAQGGCCALCKSPTPGNTGKLNFSVDHNHACCPGVRSCGKCVRALLCLRCNNNMGWLEKYYPEVTAYLARFELSV